QTLQGYYDAGAGGTNQFSIPGTAQTPLQTITSAGPDINPASTNIIPGVSPFALDYRSILTPTGFGQFFSTDDQLTVATPEPSSIVLLASGVPLCLFGLIWKRRKTAAV